MVKYENLNFRIVKFVLIYIDYNAKLLHTQCLQVNS